MKDRKRVGLIFSYDDQWIGGTYYTINLIQAFNVLPDDHQPEIIVFSNISDFSRLKQETNYSYLHLQILDERPLPRWKRGVNTISFRFLGERIFRNQYKGQLDALFLIQHCSFLDSIPIEKRIYWIADFQDKHYPEFFTQVGLKNKDDKSQWIATHARMLIFSSHAVYDDWKEFYPMHRCNVSVVHFAVTHPRYNHLDIEYLRLKYNLPKNYFFSPNQFWAHKNHIVVIRAAEWLKQQGKPVVIAFSGKENDNRNPGYTEKLKAYVSEQGLQDEVRFLGFLDRSEQLQLMKHARAVIQPSRFEGWSTVIEDALAMDQVVIASDLIVNREQLGLDADYFSQNDYIELAVLLERHIDEKRNIKIDYDSRRMAFAKKFISIVESL